MAPGWRILRQHHHSGKITMKQGRLRHGGLIGAALLLTACGSGGGGSNTPSLWIRGTHNYPAGGDVTASTPFFVNTEAGPSGQVTQVTLGYTTNSGAAWIRTNLAVNLEWSSVGGRWYNAGLGLFPAGTVIQ